MSKLSAKHHLHSSVVFRGRRGNEVGATAPPRASNVGWGLFFIRLAMEVDAKIRPPSEPQNLWIPCGESRGICGLSLRPRLHCKHLSRKRPLKRPQIAIKGAVVRRKKCARC